MGLGLILSVFLILLLLVATSSWSQWRLSSQGPLDVEVGLPLPWAGYGSSTISLSALFGAYSATLLVIGTACFSGVALGVLLGLLFINLRIRTAGQQTDNYQQFLFSLRVFGDSYADRSYWLSLAFVQLGFALSELVLLQQVFRKGLGLTEAHSLAATIAVALVCYSYCLLAGYQAVFRADVLQYLVLLAMGVVLIKMAFSSQPLLHMPRQSVSSATIAIQAVRFGPEYLGLSSPIRSLLDFVVGLPLGLMPVIGAPDNWKRVMILQRRRGTGLSSLILLFAAGLPVALISPLFFKLGDLFPDRMFPLQFILSIGTPFTKTVILLGMISAFMSTFDSAQVTAAHIMLKITSMLHSPFGNARQKYHIVLGANFLLMTVALVAISSHLPHPYAIGVFLLGPVGIVVGILTGTFIGRRLLNGRWLLSASVVMFGAWLIVFRAYLTAPQISNNPASAILAVGVGTGYHILFSLVSLLFSKRRENAL